MSLGDDFNTMLDHVSERCHQYEQAFGTAISPRLKEQLAAKDNLWDRSNFSGHLTASAIVLSDRAEVLLIKHKVLSLWLAPGGHAGPFEMPSQTSARELAEETGLRGFELHPWHYVSGIPIDIDTHPIPENKARGEAAHFHHDFRYIFTSSATDLLEIERKEVDAIRWTPLSGLEAEYPRIYQRIRALSLAQE